MWPFKKSPKWRIRPGVYVDWILEEKTGAFGWWDPLCYYDSLEEAKAGLAHMEEQGII